MTTESQARFDPRKPVDFVIVGSGAAGGILARELSAAGFDIVVLEQGPFLTAADFTHDEIGVFFKHELLGGGPPVQRQTFRDDESKVAEVPMQLPPAHYAQCVGGSSVHYTGNLWRFRQSDFRERSLLGAIDGTHFADWPVDYDELEPYYTKVDWEIGVSGAPGPFDPPRSKPYPLPPMPVKSAGVLLERGAEKLGLHAQPAPLGILSRPYRGRPGCVNCGFCMGFGCEVGAKSSTLATMIPEAIATGRCELRAGCAVFRLETGEADRVDEVLYYDPQGREASQKARAVILAANGAETPRLLLESAGSRHPDGLANSSGFVGRNLMFNGHSVAYGVFEHPLHEYKGVQCTRIVHDFYEADPARGFYGGGGLDSRPFLSATPILHALTGTPGDAPFWGAAYKDMLAHNFSRQMAIVGSTTSLPLATNNITLDPTHTDNYGRPSIRVTYRDHADDLAMCSFFRDKSLELLEAAGAVRSWAWPVQPAVGSPHLLGTCRMGDDPQTSVVDRWHRSHDVSNLFICDGSSFVTSGRGQPTMTIMALAFRAAEHIARAARANEV